MAPLCLYTALNVGEHAAGGVLATIITLAVAPNLALAQTTVTTTTTVTVAAPPPQVRGATCQWIGNVVGLDPYRDNNL
jgi:hypothetical protein